MNEPSKNNSVSSSQDSVDEFKESQVSTTTNCDENVDSNSSSTSEDDDDEEEEENSSNNSNGPSNSTTTTTTSPILRPSLFLRPSSFNNNNNSVVPRIITTPPEIPQSSSSSSSTFLRPSKLQVKESPAPPSSQEEDEEEKSSSGFVPLSKETISNGDKNEEKKPQTASESSFLFGEKLEDRVSSQERKRKVENLGDDEEAGTSSKVPALEDVDVSTGEEGEVNVLQVPCRLYSFDPPTSNWTERVSRGLLRLNDTDSNNSRLIIRTQGSLRLMLNTKIFNGMVVERPNDKSVRFTALDIQEQEQNGGKVWLVMGSQMDMDSLFSALQNRLRRFTKIDSNQ